MREEKRNRKKKEGNKRNKSKREKGNSKGRAYVYCRKSIRQMMAKLEEQEGNASEI